MFSENVFRVFDECWGKIMKFVSLICSCKMEMFLICLFLCLWTIQCKILNVWTYLPRFSGQLCNIFAVTCYLAILTEQSNIVKICNKYLISQSGRMGMYLICASFHPISIVLNQFEATLSYLLFVQFTVQMWNPCVQETIQLIGAILRYAEPKFWPQFILAVRHDIRRQRHCFTNRFAHTQSQIQRRISTCTCWSWYQFYSFVK